MSGWIKIHSIEVYRNLGQSNLNETRTKEEEWGSGTITSYIAFSMFSMANLLLRSMGLATREDEINLTENTDLHNNEKQHTLFISILIITLYSHFYH